MSALASLSRRVGTAALLLLPAVAHAQTPVQPLLSALQWRNIGPANMGGRISHIVAAESNPALVFIAAASGGVWKSQNGGTTWDQVFADYGSSNIGAVALFQPNPDIVWVGTGEGCVRNSVGWGDGIYKSTDGGRTFTNVGLRDSHHIDEIVTHPTDPDIVYVAAQGHLWGYNQERGIYRTTDGGRTWTKLTRGLPDDDRTGASDITMDPHNPRVLYAGMWERIRRAYTFESGGPHGGIYKSVDGGDSWTKLTNGLPAGAIGKVTVDVYRRDPRILIAFVEHGFQPAQNSADYRDMTKLGSGIYRSDDGGASWTYVNRFNDRPFYYSHIWFDPTDANRVFVLATAAQVSEDGGRTFSRRLNGIEGDFHAIWLNPANSSHFYVGNDKGASVTYDRGQSFVFLDNMDIGQYYAITLDNRDPYWVYGGLQDNGNWGGPSNSRDVNGILTDHFFKFHSGDGFHTTVDPNDWRTIYTESQGGNIRRLDAVFRQVGRSIVPNPSTITNFAAYAQGAPAGNRLPPSFRFNWSTPIILSPHDSRTIYYAGNHLFRSADRGDTWTIISGDLSTNDPAFQPERIGGLTREGSGAERHSTAITISESPLTRGLIWVGTDDGNVQLTRDGGASWTNVRPNIPGVPEHRWVSRVVASRFAEGTAYVTFDGHRSDDFAPYVLKTTDYGRTWTSMAAGLPADEPIYVITEDYRNRDLLFVGTEMSAFATVDGGGSWQRVMNGLPTVPVHDLVIHPRDGDLVAATHGRSLWILDDITPLQQLTPAVLAADVHMFENRVATRWRGMSRGATRGHMLFVGRNPLTIAQRPPSNSPGELQNSATVSFYLRSAPAGPVRLEITNGTQTFATDVRATAGINRYFWNLRFPAAAPAGGAAQQQGGGGQEAAAGTYQVRLTVSGRTYHSALTLREDPDAAAILGR
ncbi:MAG TPA: hypothetical protein VMN60_07700 [Longimicrobiales bacterium]|nr:hypothetical protein [Longimicrobiales bacterium]